MNLISEMWRPALCLALSARARAHTHTHIQTHTHTHTHPAPQIPVFGQGWVRKRWKQRLCRQWREEKSPPKVSHELRKEERKTTLNTEEPTKATAASGVMKQRQTQVCKRELERTPPFTHG
ncbi:unnamed protein product [Rangifer tarandus platyrhynchus]|uniref:Uncharacterized protein n=1 Tax=Rangifer tarandus platyrhynchus TaxID=3082113 RepID=A0AC59YM49_RANTA